MEVEQMSHLLLPDEVADRMRVQKSTVLAWLRDGRLRGLKVGRSWRIPEIEVNRYLDIALQEATPSIADWRP